MRYAALLLLLALAGCSPPAGSADDAPAAEAAVETPPPAPAATPVALPLNCQDADSGGYGNAKACYYDQCDKGDAEACRMAESYNGNLYPTDILDKVDCGDGSGSGPKHSKSCFFEACRQGIRDACDIATSDRPLDVIFGVSSGSQKLEDMDYLEARKVVLSLGWQPVEGPCDAISQATCADFPEIGNCSGTGLGFCDMHFRRADRCLTVVVTEGPPDMANPEGAPVDWVRFSKAPCKKDPNDP